MNGGTIWKPETMEREAFLANISTRLRRPQPQSPPERHSLGVPSRYMEDPLAGHLSSKTEWPERFREELEMLGGRVDVVDSVESVGSLLRGMVDVHRGAPLLTWNRSTFADWDIGWLWDPENGPKPFLEDIPGDSLLGSNWERFSGAALGITTVDFAIVNTGTLAIFTRPGRSRFVSLIPTIHVALIRESQLVARMGDVLSSLSGVPVEETPSSVHFISGPSRSADIENDLSIGVHGPALVYAIVCRSL